MKYAWKNSTGVRAIVTKSEQEAKNKIEELRIRLNDETIEYVGPIDDIDSYFKEIMTETDGVVSVDLEAAKTFKLDKIREARDFSSVDAKFVEVLSKAILDPANASKTVGELSALTDVDAVLSEQQALRDLPQDHEDAVNALTTLEEIKSYEV